ncbi:aKG-HExxH-type peptide beta-hydroxylase [Streptomyces olivaceus]|uniref:aKG-HExxH-type peptide beta-hydroxylase n=1 Tax=Streptomyces olivaceus TaxID=47716 RepID=UPI0036CA19EB
MSSTLAEQVDKYREQKIERLDAVLRNLPGGDNLVWDGLAAADLPLRYALAHHMFEAVSQLAQRGDAQALQAYLVLRSDQTPLKPIATTAGPVLLAHPERNAMTDDRAIAEAPVAVVSPAVCATADDKDRALVTDALETAVRSGFGATVSRNSRVIVLIAERRPTDTTIRSWTTNALPATVHLDYFAEHFYVSRDLIHEAAHTELNDLFATFDLAFPGDAKFYAPWLETKRPVFGFLHGTWAFSHVALYCQWLSTAEAPIEVRALAGAMHIKYAEHMHASRKHFDEAIKLVSVPELAEVITQCRDLVLDSHSTQ